MAEESQASTHAVRSSRGLVLGLVGVIAGMFAFGFAMVPLYDVFCEVTGLNGKTGRISADAVAAAPGSDRRRIRVELVTTVNTPAGAATPRWRFQPSTAVMEVRPGELYETTFVAENLLGIERVGQAIPSVAPSSASIHFNKTECFCFRQQHFAAGEGREMPVRFIIDPKLPASISTVTLSYTLFDVSGSVL